MVFGGKYPVKIIIYEERGGEGKYRITEDLGKRVQKKQTGDYYYQLKKRKIRTAPVPYDCIYLIETDTNGKKPKRIECAFLYSLTPFTFIPLKLNKDLSDALYEGSVTKEQVISLIPEGLRKSLENDSNPEIDIKVDDKWMFWAGQQMKQNVQRTQYKSTLDKFLPIMLVATLGIVIGIIFYMTIGQLEVIASSSASTGDKLVVISENLLEVARVMAGQPAVESPPF